MMAKTILYAEDEFTNRKIMKYQCERFGVDCVLAADGLEALERCRTEKYDLVVLDQYIARPQW